MRTTVIPQEQWSQFLQAFSAQHHDWLVEIDPNARADHRPLEAITVQLAGNAPAISIVLQDRHLPQGHAMYSIADPSMVRLEEHRNGREKRLVFGAQNGQVTTIRFHQVRPPPNWTLQKASS